MSGIEIAGIALAVFTVAVNGISHFVKAVKTINYWRRYRIKLQGYAAIIDAQRVFYLDTLEDLLEGIVESDDDLVAMMAHPRAPTWQRDEYDKRLRQRLDRSYDVYLNIIRDMLENLDSLCSQLGLSSTGKVLWDEYSVVDREMERLKVTLSKNVHQRLIASIDTANKNIREITRQSIHLEPMRKARRSRRMDLDLNFLRDHTLSLYRTFVGKTNWKCPCKSLHVVSLRLESRPRDTAQLSSTAKAQFISRILLSNTHPSKMLAGVLQWQEIETRSSIYAKLPYSNLKSATSSKKATPASCQPPESIINSPAAINNLCNIVWADTHSSESIGFLSDEVDDELKHEHYLYRVDTLPACKSQSRSLHDVLCETRNNSPLGTLLKRERLELAIILAFSVLQLDGTSWLNSQWSTHDIYFHRKLGEHSTPLTHPYLSWRQCADVEDLCVSTRTLTIGNHMIRNENLFALGLTLTELCFGKPFSALHIPKDKDSIDDVANAKCAFRLLDFVYDEMDDVYGDVVRRCLFQPPDVRDTNLNTEEVQQKVYADIVVPLIENLKNSKGKGQLRMR
ncbi:MAG: hypothetical protein Q9195_006783 [Heterodermia aff. obscurata]